MAVTEADVRKVAELARLPLAGDRIATLTAELNEILRHMDVLQQVHTPSMNAAPSIDTLGAPLRGDAVAPAPMATTAPALAAESRDGFILVPRLATHEDL